MKKNIILLPTIMFLVLGLAAVHDVSARAYYSGRLVIKDPDNLNPSPNQRWWHASAYLSYYQKAGQYGETHTDIDGMQIQIDIPINVSATSQSLCQTQFTQAKNLAMSLNTGVSSWISMEVPCHQ